MVLWLSQNKVVGFPSLFPIYVSTFLSHEAYAIVDISVIYLAFVEDNAIVACFLELHVINIDPKEKHYPLMEFLSYMLLPQLLLLKPTSFNCFA